MTAGLWPAQKSGRRMTERDLRAAVVAVEPDCRDRDRSGSSPSKDGAKQAERGWTLGLPRDKRYAGGRLCEGAGFGCDG